MIKSRKIITFVMIVVFTFTISQIVQNKLNKKSTPKLYIKKNVVTFGQIKQGNDYNRYVIYKNIGNGFLKINRITSTCGCTITKWNEKNLNKGENDTVFINYSADNLGAFIKSFYIYSNSSTSPDIIYLKGFCVE